jgi:hypothetical protein
MACGEQLRVIDDPSRSNALRLQVERKERKKQKRRDKRENARGSDRKSKPLPSHVNWQTMEIGRTMPRV